MRNALFGSVINPDTTLSATISNSAVPYHPVFGAKIITDFSLGYDLTELMTVTLGSSNLFDVYPDASPSSLTSGNNFIYPRVTSQFGINGRTVFARLKFKLQ